MADIAKREFAALDVTGDNYCSWIVDVQAYLKANGYENTIVANNEESEQNKAKAMIFIRHHLHETLKAEYLTVVDPYELWKNLKERYGHYKITILPRLIHQWTHLRFQDFPTVRAYNSAVHRITSQMKLCGAAVTEDEMLEKTYTTFHASNLVLQQQYRAHGFKTHNELIACLLVAEENNSILMANHESRPTGSRPYPEANVVQYHYDGHSRGRGRGRGRNRGRGGWHGRGRSHVYNNTWHRNDMKSFNFKKHVNNDKAYKLQKKTPREGKCHKCGKKGHWERDCYTSQYKVDRYQASIKNKGKEKVIETNLVAHHDQGNNVHFNYSDFTGHISGQTSNRHD